MLPQLATHLPALNDHRTLMLWRLRALQDHLGPARAGPVGQGEALRHWQSTGHVMRRGCCAAAPHPRPPDLP